MLSSEFTSFSSPFLVAVIAVFLVFALSVETEAKPGSNRPDIKKNIHKAILPFLNKLEKELEKINSPQAKQAAKDAIHKDLLVLKGKLSQENFDKFEKEIFSIIDNPKNFHFPTLKPAAQ